VILPQYYLHKMHEAMDIVPTGFNRQKQHKHVVDTDTHSIASHDTMGDMDNRSNMSINSTLSRNIPSNGNYKGYYKFRELQQYENTNRIVGFQKSWFHEQRVLDIGCNEGDLTMLIAKEFNPFSIIGIDVDKRLIESAGASVKRAMYDYRIKRKKGSQLPSINENDSNSNNNDRLKVSSSSLHNAFIPRTLALAKPIIPTPLYPGHIVTTSPTDNNNGQFPFNTIFKCEDIMDRNCSLIDDQGYGVILCMSVSKWIHLNHGDEGIIRFFNLLFRLTVPGGKVIMEVSDSFIIITLLTFYRPIIHIVQMAPKSNTIEYDNYELFYIYNYLAVSTYYFIFHIFRTASIVTMYSCITHT
jgi:7SK snRNA methylphosphate capping enzyme